ncbi:MAG TPA: NAD-dependent epimerase/dehydratase family protein [Candidatus Korarchaeota archaeon]|nr:NAD-dependent epimerase/dehydratase family protein [Candidatus Korarchaeota archaeon]
MRFLILGSGLMGSVAAKYLIEKDIEVSVGSNDKKSLKYCADFVGDPRLETVLIDVSNHDETTKFLKENNFDVVINALPHVVSVPAIKAEIDAGVNIVDMAFERDQMHLRDRAKEMGVTMITGCGVDPGIGNMLAGYGVVNVKNVESVKIYCGGLPRVPKPPLNYRILFHINSVWNVYTRKARIIRNGSLQEVEALSGLEPIYVEGVGQLEAFFTDGLASLTFTFMEDERFRGIKDMFEKTLRYPGHVDKVKALIECELLSKEPINFKGMEITPREFLNTILGPKLRLGDEEDLMVLKVIVEGEGGEEKQVFELVDYYDKKKKVTAMGRTTAYTASIVASLIASGKIRDKGMVTTEDLGTRKEVFREIIRMLREENIRIKAVKCEVLEDFTP